MGKMWKQASAAGISGGGGSTGCSADGGCAAAGGTLRASLSLSYKTYIKIHLSLHYRGRNFIA